RRRLRAGRALTRMPPPRRHRCQLFLPRFSPIRSRNGAAWRRRGRFFCLSGNSFFPPCTFRFLAVIARANNSR
ncbi:MAG: hypothetical protein WBG17_14875, partial [Burkholderiaceae bacterium]